MKKLIMSILIVISALVISGIILSYFFLLLIDLRAFISVPILAAIYVFILHGFKKSINSFTMPLKDDVSNAELQSSLKFFNNLGSAYLYFSGFVVSICIIDMFIKLNEKVKIGPRLAMALISILYAVLMHLLIVIPYKGIINRKIDRSV
jgi:hypothetical protein